LEAINEFWDLGLKGMDEQDTALHHACFIMNPDLVSFLITYGADINRQNGKGETPL
jgi:ankyrin repeat protein